MTVTEMKLRDRWAAIAAGNGISRNAFNNRVRYGWGYERAAIEPLRKPKEYALYKGDELIAVGTMREIEAVYGKRKHKLYCYNTPTHRRRIERSIKKNCLQLIPLEDDEVM